MIKLRKRQFNVNHIQILLLLRALLGNGVPKAPTSTPKNIRQQIVPKANDITAEKDRPPYFLSEALQPSYHYIVNRSKSNIKINIYLIVMQAYSQRLSKESLKKSHCQVNLSQELQTFRRRDNEGAGNEGGREKEKLKKILLNV